MKLIIRVPNWVGDAVMALPTVAAAAEATGASSVAVMARGAVAPLFQNRPDVGRVIIIEDKRSRLLGPLQAARLVREGRYDIGLILPTSFSSALVFKLAGVRGRVGYGGDGRSRLLTRTVAVLPEKSHRAAQYFRLLQQLTATALSITNPVVVLSHENIAAAEKTLAAYSLSCDEPYIAIAPQATAPSRRWGAANYGHLAATATAEFNCRVILVGAAAEHEAGEAVRRYANDRIVNLCGETDLMTAAAIISFARVFVGNDSGLAHVAAAVGAPLVVLSGADDPEETSPLAKHKRVIIKDIDCISCVKNVCPKKGDAFLRCMKLITVEEVLDAAREIIRA